MVFLGGAVLANIVRISVGGFCKPGTDKSTTDGGQGKHVDIKAGMGRTGYACVGEARCSIDVERERQRSTKCPNKQAFEGTRI